MAVISTLSQLSLQTIMRDGVVQNLARLYFYVAGTSTPLPVYRDNLLSVAYPQYVEVGNNGRVPPIYVGEGFYKVRITDRYGVQLEEIDGIQGAVDTSGSGGGPTPGGTTIPPGFMMPAHLVGTLAGWVRANGRTIGDAVSGASERANDDCKDCFIALWGADATLVVTGGRGLTALADWNAHKQLTLPDYRGRAVVGLDDMGNTAAGKLAGVTFDSGTATTLGAGFGKATETLTIDQMPSHKHDATSGYAGGHTHTGATDVAGAHTHTTGYPDGAFTVSLPGSRAYIAGVGDLPTTTVNTISVSGNHQHVLSIAGVADHVHVIDVVARGGGLAHNNAQPSRLATVYIKL